ncbi:MAG: response regulator [Oscillospiraceae bacterium]|jgi:CheY-like chemotaxis protein|nr:response regulator [Oscillospiraceae bacterium]
MSVRNGLKKIKNLDISSLIDGMSGDEFDEYVMKLNLFIDSYPMQEQKLKDALSDMSIPTVTKGIEIICHMLRGVHADEINRECSALTTRLTDSDTEQLKADAIRILADITTLSIDIQMVLCSETADDTQADTDTQTETDANTKQPDIDEADISQIIAELDSAEENDAKASDIDVPNIDAPEEKSESKEQSDKEKLDALLSSGTGKTPDPEPEVKKDAEASILAVDDTAFFLSYLKSILSNSGYNLTCVNSGDAALNYIKTHTPDLFILDIDMPGMDGYELAIKIRANKHTAPIVFLTANATRENVFKAIKVGAADFITKPMNREDAITRISKHI